MSAPLRPYFSVGEKDKLQPVSPARSLRPSSRSFLHALRPNGQEIVVVRDRNPYGALTPIASSESAHANHLLQIAGIADPDTVFEIDDELLGLPAATFGSLNRMDLLQPVYTHLREVVLDAARLAHVDRLSIGDFAVSHNDGSMVFLPPINFLPGESDTQELLDQLASDVEHNYQATLGLRGVNTILSTLRGQ